MNLVTHAVGVHHHAGVLSDDDSGDGNAARRCMYGNIHDPSVPRGAKAWEAAVRVPGIRHTAPMQHAFVVWNAARTLATGVPAGMARCFGHNIAGALFV